jgi:6,7-dimethyl-8-ribityllumazine synthase
MAYDGGMDGRDENPFPSPPRVAVIVSRYNWSITQRLLEGALAEYAARGHEAGSVTVFECPGAYELPALSLAAADTGRYRGIVAIGCIIRGETRHDQYIAQAIAHGLLQVTLQVGIPVTFGVLTVDTPEQARARAGGAEHGNKGQEAMAALLDTIIAMDAIRDADADGVAVAGEHSRPRDKAEGD